MRAFVFLLLGAAIAIGVLIMTNVITVEQIQAGRLPDIDVTVRDPGQLPEYEVKTGDVNVTTETKTIEVPEVEVTPAE
ncbi:hypothetical protein [Methylobrevis albus]|uniref:Uncharacterized protein n=1 Tax=Methylobrevis albus TaxID=2793297 RepID=A0A931I2X8_9HYPH|nr:hypothetical protein [Methylobrevis albus]MBH0238857.1 hypothetical protein [Methylobrevis albus]